MGKTSKLDDILFAMYKAGGNTVDALGNVTRKFDPSAMIAKMGRGSFFTNMDIPEVPLMSSKMFHTPDYLSNLSKVELDELVDVDLKSFQNNLDVDFNTVDFNNLDLLDIDATDLGKVIDNYSAAKVSGISEGLETARKTNLDEIGSDSVSNTTFDNALKTDPKHFDNTQDMASTLRKSDGVDAEGVNTKNRVSNYDDIVNGNINDIRKMVETLNTIVSVSVLAAYAYQSYLNRTTVEEGAFDDAVEVGDIEEISYETGVDLEGIVRQNTKEEEVTDSTDSTLIIGIIIAASIAFLNI